MENCSTEELKKSIRILYVCPWAARTGHYPQAVVKETTALHEAGVDIYICTFSGIRDEEAPQAIPHRTVVSSRIGFLFSIVTRSLNFSPRVSIIAKLLEAIATLFLAIKLKSSIKYNVYLRDGDPFIFLPLLFGLFFKHYKWVILLTGQMGQRATFNFFPYKFSIAHFWKPVYQRSLSRNRYTFICENRYVKDFFEGEFLGGILSGRVALVPRGGDQTNTYIPRKEARQYLGLPEDKFIFLHFGVLHLGQDIKTIFIAIKDMPDVLLIPAGKVTSPIDILRLVKRYNLQNRIIIKDYYIPEAEKQYYFASADAIILSYKKDFVQTASMLWEAAKFRLPAIASDVGELGELVKRYQTGLVFRVEDAASLNGAISLFLALNQGQREVMESNCEKFCEEFSFNGWARKSIDILKELCVTCPPKISPP